MLKFFNPQAGRRKIPFHSMAEGAGGWKAGDRVLALLPDGGYAERAAVDSGLLLRLPEGWSFPQGTAVPETAHAYVRENRNIGKVILEVPGAA